MRACFFVSVVRKASLPRIGRTKAEATLSLGRTCGAAGDRGSALLLAMHGAMKIFSNHVTESRTAPCNCFAVAASLIVCRTIVGCRTTVQHCASRLLVSIATAGHVAASERGAMNSKLVTQGIDDHRSAGRRYVAARANTDSAVSAVMVENICCNSAPVRGE